MRRPLALLAAVLALAARPALAGEPLDLDLTRLGAPRAALWPAGTPSAAAAAAASRIRFARLATDLALAFSSPLLEPASTTGADGWDVAVEATSTPVSRAAVGSAADVPPGFRLDVWPTREVQPTGLFMPSLHLRKAFPYSIEVGGRLTYLSRSQLYASQLSLKWAFLEGYARLPDVAVRLSYTRMDGQRELAVATTELDLLASHRFGVNAIVSLTPYLGLRYSWLHAGTRPLQWTTSPADPASASAAFPGLDGGLYRTTLGLRMTSYAVALAAELTWFGGTSSGSSGNGEDGYPRYRVPSSLATAFRLGFEF
jgi:hypothetical protein